jgi:hypothetical protein
MASSASSVTLRRLSVLAALVALSLVPAVLLYLLFGELNSATVEKTGLKLGGPVAAFFVALYGLWKMYKGMRSVDNPFESRLQALVGAWQIESKSSESGRKATSSTKIALEEGELRIDGGTFFAVGTDGSQGDAIGSWSVEMAVSDGRRLKYFYSLTDNLASHSTWKGLVEVAAPDDSDVQGFQGTWQVLGKEHHRGTISITRKK